MLKSNSFFLQSSQTKQLIKTRHDSLASQRRSSIDRSDKVFNISNIKPKPDPTNESIDSMKQEQVEIDLEVNEYKQKYMNQEENNNQPTSIKIIEKDLTPTNAQTPPLKLFQLGDDPDLNTSTIKSAFGQQNINFPNSPFTRTSKKTRNLSMYQQESFHMSNSSPRSPPFLQISNFPQQYTISPYEKFQQQLHPSLKLDGIQNYQRHLKKHDTLRTFGNMFQQVQMVRLKPQMTERILTYDIFHQNNYKKSVGDMDYKGKAKNVTERNQKSKQKKGVMYTNELWSDSYYQKIFKSSMLDKIEQQINLEKMQQTAKESQKNLNQYFESLFDSNGDLKKFDGMFSKRRISLNQNDFLNSYINNQVNTTNALVTQRSIQHSSGNMDQSQQLSEGSQNSIKLNAKISTEWVPSLTHAQSNQNIFQNMIKKSAFSQNNQTPIENYYFAADKIESQADQVESHSNTYTNECQITGQQISTSQAYFKEDEQYLQPPPQQKQLLNQFSQNQPYFPREQVFTIYNQLVNEKTFKKPKNPLVKRYCNSLTCRHNHSRNPSLHIQSKGFETSRNNSPELSTKASPFFSAQKTSQLNTIQNFALNMEKSENKTQKFQVSKQQIASQLSHRRTFSEHLPKNKINTQFDSATIRPYNQYKTEISQILQECQNIQNDNIYLKDKIKEQMREPHIQNQLSKDFGVVKKKKQYLIALNTKQVDTREAIDQRRKYMNSFKILRQKETEPSS